MGGNEDSLPLWVKSQTRIFVPSPPLPPYRIDFAKNRKKSESTQNGLIQQEIEKKILPLGDPPPPKKKLRKIFKIFESCSESSETSRKLKISKKKFFSYDQKNYLKVVQNHLKHEKNSKKNSFFPVPISDLTLTDLGPSGNRSWT